MVHGTANLASSTVRAASRYPAGGARADPRALTLRPRSAAPAAAAAQVGARAEARCGRDGAPEAVGRLALLRCWVGARGRGGAESRSLHCGKLWEPLGVARRCGGAAVRRGGGACASGSEGRRGRGGGTVGGSGAGRPTERGCARPAARLRPRPRLRARALALGLRGMSRGRALLAADIAEISEHISAKRCARPPDAPGLSSAPRANIAQYSASDPMGGDFVCVRTNRHALQERGRIAACPTGRRLGAHPDCRVRGIQIRSISAAARAEHQRAKQLPQL